MALLPFGSAQGVKSISKSGSPKLKGDVTLSEGSNITLNQTGNNIEIIATGGSGGSGTRYFLYRCLAPATSL